MPVFEPAYLALLRDGTLAARVETAYAHLAACDLCAWTCRANRQAGKLGTCQTGIRARVSAAHPHPGEEACLSGTHGSGTIFFAGCNLRCQFCQNYAISQPGQTGDQAPEVEPDELAAMMLALQDQGCHNINLVSPSHVIAPILAAVAIAAACGLRLPLVYNTGGYDSPAGLALLDSVIDIYLPDMKFADAKTGRQLSRAADYPRHNQRAVQIMHAQVGDLVLDPATGLAQRGLLVRHLVLPDDLAGTRLITRCLARKVSPTTAINVMGQYRPAYRAAERDLGPLSRPVTPAEVQAAQAFAEAAGLRCLDR